MTSAKRSARLLAAGLALAMAGCAQQVSRAGMSGAGSPAQGGASGSAAMSGMGDQADQQMGAAASQPLPSATHLR